MTHANTIAMCSLVLCFSACGGATEQTENHTSSPGEVSASTEAPAPAGVSQAEAREAVEGLDVSQFTSAPRRLLAKAELDAPVEEVWTYISNHDNLVEYTNGVLTEATIDRAGASETNGVGTRRECQAGDDRFVENIVYFRAPYVFAYQAVENTWGLDGHLATVVLKPSADGGTVLEWSQYFNTVQPDMAPMMTQNMTGMFQQRVLPFFTERFGGEVLPS
ncbi:MAG: SRPBCC family protein [Myxococcota bacterium]